MKLREALRTYAPSLALQREAMDEIARLDAALKDIKTFSLEELLVVVRDRLYSGQEVSFLPLELVESVQRLCEELVVNRKAENEIV